MDERPTISTEKTTFPSWKVSTKKVTLPRNTTQKKNLWIVDRLRLQNGFKVVHQIGHTGSVEFSITYDPSVDGHTIKPMEVHHNYLDVTVVGGEKDQRITICLPVEVEDNGDRELSDTMKCTVCYRLFSDVEDAQKPKSLPGCGHTFCSSCVERLNKRFCPTCRKVNDVDAAKIPINYNLMNLIGEIRTEQNRPSGRQEIVRDPFVPCFEHPQHESKVYCNDCRQAYCQRCFSNAHVPKFMKDHKTIPVINMPVIIPKCPNCPKVSNGNIYYCSLPGCAKNRITCVKCCHIYHRNHNLEMIAPQLEKNYTKVQNLLKEVKGEVKQYEKAEYNLKKSLYNSEEQQHAHILQICIHFDKLQNAAVSKYRSFMKNEIQKLQGVMDSSVRKSSHLKKMETRIEGCLKRKRELHDVDEMMEEAKNLMKTKSEVVKGEYCLPKDYIITPDMSVDPKPPTKRPRLEDPVKNPGVAPPLSPVAEFVDNWDPEILGDEEEEVEEDPDILVVNDHDYHRDREPNHTPVVSDVESNSEVESEDSDDEDMEAFYRWRRN